MAETPRRSGLLVCPPPFIYLITPHRFGRRGYKYKIPAWLQAELHSTCVWKLFLFPPQPPYTNGLQTPSSPSKYQRTLYLLQYPVLRGCKQSVRDMLFPLLGEGGPARKASIKVKYMYFPSSNTLTKPDIGYIFLLQKASVLNHCAHTPGIPRYNFNRV